MDILGMNITDASAQKEPYKRFVEQLSGWYGGGEMPQLASQDLRFAAAAEDQLTGA